MVDACAPNSSSIRSFVPHSDGDETPAGGGTNRPTTLNSWPTNPSGVQLARPMRPPGRTTRRSSLAARGLVRREHHAERREHDVERTVGERQVLGVGDARRHGEPVGLGAAQSLGEQLGHVVGRDDVGAAAGGGQRCVAVAGGDVEHAVGRAEVDGLAQGLADDLKRHSDAAEVAGRPGGLLAGLQGIEIGNGRVGHGLHGTSPWSGGACRSDVQSARGARLDAVPCVWKIVPYVRSTPFPGSGFLSRCA
jgi:hypothetical protein